MPDTNQPVTRNVNEAAGTSAPTPQNHQQTSKAAAHDDSSQASAPTPPAHSKPPKKTGRLTLLQVLRAATIAAIYTLVTIALSPLSYGPLQIRFAEALTILPFIMPEAVLGVTAGCLLSNLLSFAGWVDIVFGTLTTFAAACLTRLAAKFLRRRASVFIAAAPPVLLNAIVVPIIIFAYLSDDLASIGIHTNAAVVLYLCGFTSVLIGQAIAVYGLGIPLYFAVKRLPRTLLRQ